MQQQKDSTRVNEKIRAREVRLVDAEGQQLGVMSTQEALRKAQDSGLDLVEVAPNAVPPVCRIMDYGKYKYQMGKKAAQKRVELKEVKVRPRIGEHDLELKVRNIRKFLDEGNKAKISMYFRGREIVRPEMGLKVFEKIKELLPGKFSVEMDAKLEGNHVTMVIAPKS